MAQKSAIRFTDLLREKLNGPETDFARFMQRFNIATKASNTSDENAVQLLVAYTEGPCLDEAVEFITKYETDSPPPDSGTAAARKDYYKDQLAALKTHLGKAPTVVGSAPEVKLMGEWKQLSQGDKETVQAFYQRVKKLVHRLAGQKQPVKIDKTQQAFTFTAGLKPKLRVQVRLNVNADAPMEEVLSAVEQVEAAFSADESSLAPQPPVPERQGPSAEDRAYNALAERLAYDRQIHDESRSFRRPGAVRSAGLPQGPRSTQPGPPRARDRGAVNRGGAQTMPGQVPQICIDYLKHQQCKFGDSCIRLHLLSLDQNEDVRPGVKVKVTDEMRDQVKAVMARYPNGPPSRQPRGPTTGPYGQGSSKRLRAPLEQVYGPGQATPKIGRVFTVQPRSQTLRQRERGRRADAD